MEINKIYNEDCLDTMAKMPDGFIDLTVTSPPYDNLRTYSGNVIWDECVWKHVIKELYRVSKRGGVVVWVVSDATIKGSETGTSFKQALFAKECGFNLHDTMIYAKNKPSGILDGMNEKAIALASKFSGDENKFIEVLLALKFIEKSKNGTCCLHDWSMHNSFVYHADGRKQQARVAAKARWESKRGVKKTKEKQEVNADRITDSNADLEKSNAECNAPYPYPTPYPYPYPKEHSTKLGIVKTTKQNFPSEPNSALSHERNAKNPKNENSTQQTPAEFDEDAFRCQAKLKRCSESAIGYAIEEMRKAKGLTNPHGYALKIARDKTQRENAEKSEKESTQHKQDLGQIHSNLSRLSMQIGKAF